MMKNLVLSKAVRPQVWTVQSQYQKLGQRYLSQQAPSKVQDIARLKVPKVAMRRALADPQNHNLPESQQSLSHPHHPQQQQQQWQQQQQQSKYTEAQPFRAYCVARQYNLEKVVELLKPRFDNKHITKDLNGYDYVHVRFNDDAAESFILGDGCLVSWNTQKTQDTQLLSMLKACEVESFDQDLRDSEELKFKYTTDALYDNAYSASSHNQSNQHNASQLQYPHHQQHHHHHYNSSQSIPVKDKGNMLVGEDVVLSHLQPPLDNFYAKLAFSHGLAKSVQLGVLENHLSMYLERIEEIPKQMMKGMRPKLRSRQIITQHGQLLYLRGLLNLHSELVDNSPDFYWSRPDLAKHIEQISRILDISPRIRILNQRLDHASSLISLMQDDLNVKHGVRMEIIIIALIAVEVLFESVHYLDTLGWIDLQYLLGYQQYHQVSPTDLVQNTQQMDETSITNTK
ncbi:hypothetical protein MIR68_009515 [Amoeboaphelidium protococcarum]|nr:hypothetical protein MIR68_009515 [Amoeboaphelidium protococcarum]